MANSATSDLDLRCLLRPVCNLISLKQPASVAQLDARPTGDQAVGGLTPTGSATFFCGD